MDRLIYISSSDKNQITSELTLLTYCNICRNTFNKGKIIDLGGISTPLSEDMNGIDKLKNRFGGIICSYQARNNFII